MSTSTRYTHVYRCARHFSVLSLNLRSISPTYLEREARRGSERSETLRSTSIRDSTPPAVRTRKGGTRYGNHVQTLKILTEARIGVRHVREFFAFTAGLDEWIEDLPVRLPNCAIFFMLRDRKNANDFGPKIRLAVDRLQKSCRRLRQKALQHTHGQST